MANMDKVGMLRRLAHNFNVTGGFDGYLRMEAATLDAAQPQTAVRASLPQRPGHTRTHTHTHTHTHTCARAHTSCFEPQPPRLALCALSRRDVC